MKLAVRPRHFERLSEILGVDLWVQEEYLLPCPLAGNKWIKLIGQYGNGLAGSAYITNGGMSSNHCRTLAIWSAFYGHRCHVVLHNDKQDEDPLALQFLRRLGATYTIVNSAQIAETIAKAEESLSNEGYQPVVVPGGGHSTEAVRAYADYASEVLAGTDFDSIFHASGTGGTQAGLCIANEEVDSQAKVVGISVARSEERGTCVVEETIRDTAGIAIDIDFRDQHVDGGYGPGNGTTGEAMAIAGSGGLILDSTYTGKAFAGLLQAVRTGEIAPGSKVLFWHTGGAYLAMNPGGRV